MKAFPVLATLALAMTGLRATPFQQAQVSQSINSVALVENEKSTPAKVGDAVHGQTAVKTGGDSRAELTFPDLTITRLGADTLFSFQSGGRNMDLEEGTMLFACPKNQGGGQVQAGAVTAAVTGTQFLFSRFRNGNVKLVVLEGHVFLFFTKNPSERREFKAGELVTVPSHSGHIPTATLIDLKRLIATSRLLDGGGFKPFPRETILVRVADAQQGHIRHIPDAFARGTQTAQTSRQTTTHLDEQNRHANPPSSPPHPNRTPQPHPNRPVDRPVVRPTPPPQPSPGPY